MELTDYWRILRKWSLLITIGTLLALAIGVALDFEGRVAGSSAYQASATVQVNYAAPAYIQGISLSDEASALSERVHDPGALGINPRVTLSGVDSISAAVDPTAPQIVVTGVATSASIAQTAANRVAHYLAGLEDAKVASESKSLRAKFSDLVARDRHNWLTLQALYNRLSTPPPRASLTRLAILSANVQFWQNQYNHDLGNLGSLTTPSVPAAAVTSATPGAPVKTKPSSLLKTVLPAPALGFMLSFFLAVFLDSRQANSGALGPLGFLAGKQQPRLRVPVLGHLERVDPWLGQSGGDFDQSSGDPRSKVLSALAAATAQTADVVARLLLPSGSTLFVTSPTFREPKAETAVGLAASLARHGRRVVLIDADPAGGVTCFFDLAGRPGLTDYLGYPRMALLQLVYPAELGADKGELSVLPLGTRDLTRDENQTTEPSTPADDERAFSAALSELTQKADLVLVNGPPALEAPHSMAIAAGMAGAVVVIRRDHADDDLTKAYDVLRAQRVRVLGLVVNPGRRAADSEARLTRTSELSTPLTLQDPGTEYQENS